jgi:hypothetical protein
MKDSYIFPNNEKKIPNYSDQLLEISSTRNEEKNSEYRVLDARRWNH